MASIQQNLIQQRIKVLIVDDQIIIRSILRSLLTKAGFSVVGESSNGEKALALTTQLLPDLVCLDITMPGISGLDTLKHIKQTHPKIKVVMITGHQGKQDVEGALAAGADGYIIKPFKFSTLIATLSKISQ